MRLDWQPGFQIMDGLESKLDKFCFIWQKVEIVLNVEEYDKYEVLGILFLKYSTRCSGRKGGAKGWLSTHSCAEVNWWLD